MDRVRLDESVSWECYLTLGSVDAINELIKEMKVALAAEITATMNVKPVDCTLTAGPPDDLESTMTAKCDYADRIDSAGNYEKDCKCAPLLLGSVNAISVSCSDDRSFIKLGEPAVTFSPDASPNNPFENFLREWCPNTHAQVH